MESIKREMDKMGEEEERRNDAKVVFEKLEAERITKETEEQEILAAIELCVNSSEEVRKYTELVARLESLRTPEKHPQNPALGNGKSYNW